MELTSHDGANVKLHLIQYQFPDHTPPRQDQDWDANWLIVRGDIRTGGSRAWSFQDPCLTTWEAGHLSTWLRDVASAVIPAFPRWDADDEGPMAVFTEPVLAFSVQDYAGKNAVIRVHFSLEASPPWLNDKTPDSFDYSILITMQLDQHPPGSPDLGPGTFRTTPVARR